MLLTRSQLKLSTISAARSAFCLFTFEPAFFSKYRITAKSKQRGEPAAVQLQILGKTLHDIFKQKAVASAQRISLSIPASDFNNNNNRSRSPSNSDNENDSASRECRLTITIFCPHGVKKTYRLTYANAACMVALANKDDCSSSVTASPRIIKDWVDHFMLGKHGTDEITFWYTSEECRVKSFEGSNNAILGNGDNAAGNRGRKNKDDTLSRQSISTTLNVHTDEFDAYTLGTEEALITVTLKEFKAIIEFAMAISNSVDMHFNRGGEPLISSLETDSLSIQFVLSTNADDPAGIQREEKQTIQQDIKPRLSQARLTSLAPSQQNPSRQISRAPSSVVLPRNLSNTPGPPPPARKNGKPLFQPRDEDDKDESSLAMHSNAQGGENSRRLQANTRATPIDLDNEDELWAEVDEQDPSFSQHAMALSQVAGEGHSDRADGSRINEDEMEGRPKSTQQALKRKAGEQRQREMEGISLDEEEETVLQEEEEEESIDMAEEVETSKRRGKQVNRPAEVVAAANTNIVDVS